MTSYPEFDPLHAPEDPAAVDLPSPFEEEEEPPSLEGMIFCSYLTEEDLTGANWEKATPLPELPAVMWDELPVPEEAVMRAIAAARFEPRAVVQAAPTPPPMPVAPAPPIVEPVAALPAAPALPLDPEVASEESGKSPALPASSRLKPRSKFNRRFVPPGRAPAAPVASSLYGNLADTSWLEAERVKSAASDLEAPATQPESVELNSAKPESAKPGATHTHTSPGSPMQETLSVLELPPSALAADTPPAPRADRVFSIALAPREENLSVLEAPPSPQENCTEQSTKLAEAAGETGIEPAASADATAGTPQLEEGLVDILAFQPPELSDHSGKVSLAEPEEDYRPLFQSFYKPAPALRMQVRIPHFGHLALLVLLGFTGLVCSSFLTRAALHFHLWGVSTAAKAATDIHYTIGFMAGIYLITFGLSVVIFPLWWHRSFFSGLQWNAAGAWRRIGWLVGAACVCFVLALVDEIVLPGPTNAPIDKMFDSRTAAWLLLIFGVTFAPFFEEIVFRGFLLPALSTAFDWYGEKLTGNPATPPDADGHPQWSVPAMILAAICTSIPFAGMHAEQTGYSIGPFVLLVAVSLVLCWARLRTRSLAASVLVHASYNTLLFSIMLAGTGGFKHLDKM
jgi:hypothetical protein